MTIYHLTHQPMTGACERCGREDIPDDDLFLAVRSDEWESSWIGVPESCDDGDGSLRFHGRTLAELRAHTVFDDWMTGRYERLPVVPL